MKNIGSFIELELESGRELFRDVPLQDIVRLNTCRAAICHAVRCYGVKKVWIAKYQCDVVRDFLLSEGLEVLYYKIDEHFNPVLDSNTPDSAIVLTNYFGLLGDRHFDALVSRFNNVIIDNAQALFYHPRKDSISCYSPRKFVGSPDGAYVIGRNVNRFNYEQDISSDTSQFLLMRYEYGCEGAGYVNKKGNDKRIDESGIKTMSKLTYALLDSFDYDAIISKRKRNFAYAAELFNDINKLEMAAIVDEDAVPMGYPLWTDSYEIIPEFHKNKIYQARFWEYLIDDINLGSLEYSFARYMALICIDQRYGREEIDFQKKIVDRLKQENECTNRCATN